MASSNPEHIRDSDQLSITFRHDVGPSTLRYYNMGKPLEEFQPNKVIERFSVWAACPGGVYEAIIQGPRVGILGMLSGKHIGEYPYGDSSAVPEWLRSHLIGTQKMRELTMELFDKRAGE